MLEQLKSEIAALWRDARPKLQRLALRLATMARATWHIVRPALVTLLQLVAALIILFEEWGYRPLAEFLGRLARFRPWAMLELWIAGLPPYGALAVFALPTTVLLPLKFVALWLLANGYYATATGLFIGAKIASTAFVARIFMLTKPALMQIGWFARAYNWFVPWKEVIFAQIRASWVWRYGRMVKMRVRHEAKQMWQRWRPTIARWGADLRVQLQAARVRIRMWTGDMLAKLRSQVVAVGARVRAVTIRLTSRIRRT